MFDLDHFKAVNDTHGHIIGDELLKLFSSTLKKNFDSDTIIGRMGGDEFAVYEFHPLDKQLTINKIIVMQKEFNSATKKILNQGTASFSVGIVSRTKLQSLYDNLYTNADHALYQAKQLGCQTYYWYDA